MLYTIIHILYCHHHIILYNLYSIIKEIHNTIGEPWPQIITNWVSTTGTSSIRGELQETNLSGLKSKLYHNRVFPTDSTAFYNLSVLYLSKSEISSKKKNTCMGSITSSIAYNSNTYPPPSKEKYVLIFNLYTNKIKLYNSYVSFHIC